MSQSVTLIAAIGINRELGYRNQLIWRIARDLQRFKQLTWGHTLLMGRHTFESIGRVLPGRHTVVFSHNRHWHAPEGIELSHDPLLWLEQHPQQQVFVAGGAKLYASVWAKAQVLEITHIDEQAQQADVFFPPIEPTLWRQVSSQRDDTTTPKICFARYERMEGAPC